MKSKKIRNAYWIATIFFAALMLLDGYAGVTKQQAGQDVLKHLGYPMYALVIFGTAKILGAIAILQTRYYTIKEWAYAGFAFNYIGAFASRLAMGDSAFETIFPLIALAIWGVPYFLWKRYEPGNRTVITA